MDSVRDKVVIVTGASSGIGASTAILFAKYGAKLALTGRNKANLEKTADACNKAGVAKENIIIIVADFRKRNEIEEIVKQTAQKYDTIDVLVNNAARSIHKTIQNTTMEEMDDVFQVNLFAPVQLTKHAISYLKASKGCVVNVSSIFSIRPHCLYGASCMSKAAIDMFTSTLVLELSQSGVRLNTVHPAYTLTPIFKTLGISSEEMEKLVKQKSKEHPAGRVANPDELANAIVYLCSDAASFVNGLKMTVDGGIMQTSSWYLAEMEELAKQ